MNRKQLKNIVACTLMLTISITACKKNNGGISITPPSTTAIDVRGSITTNQTWTKNNVYRLRGYVYVESGATLTIEPGTKIISNKDSAGVLIIYKDAKIEAKGTATEPIVFTSGEPVPAPGDLGGIIIVGNATGNKNHGTIEGGVDDKHKSFGGNNDDDNSGTLSYVRIEYGGKAVNPGDEVNGLSLYTVGRGTTIDHIQVVRGLDDAYEFFGGTVNCKYLIAYNTADDDFDMDDGYRGKIQFALSIKDPHFTDNKGTSGDVSNNIEIDNTNGKIPFTTTPITSPVMSNFTIIGPNNITNASSDFGYGARFRRGSMPVLANSIIIGSKKASLFVETDETIQSFIDGQSMFYNNLVHSIDIPFITKPTTLLTNDGLKQLVTGNIYVSVLLNSADEAELIAPFNNAKPDAQPKKDSKALTTSAKFDKSSLSDSFFVKTNYIGAFDGSTDWTNGWAVWGK